MRLLSILIMSGVLASFFLIEARAQSARTVYENFSEHVSRRSAISSVGIEEGFGDRTDLNSGSTSFYVTAAELPGNSSLEVAVKFKYTPHSFANTYGWMWERDTPYLTGEFARWTGWVVGDAQNPSNLRCSYPNLYPGPPEVANTDGKPGTFMADEYWKGNRLVLPGGGGALLNTLEIPVENQPASGGPFKWVTNDGWFFSCIPLATGPGEGFLGHAPDGTKYYFDRFDTGAQVDNLKKYNYLGETILQRVQLRISVSRIEDRFGNYVEFNPPSAPSSIVASDGRRLTTTVPAPGVLAITDGSRQWTVTQGPLTITYPDGSTWKLGKWTFF